MLCVLLLQARAWDDEEGQCAADDPGCAAKGEVEAVPEYPACKHSCDERPYIGPDSGNTDTIWPTCPEGPDACSDCQDRNHKCPKFAAAYDGYGCQDNPAFMIDVCAKSCNTCHLRNMTARCEGIFNEPEALQPGDLNATFKRILSLPELRAEVLSEDPWIVRFPKFLSDEEIEYLTNPDAFGHTWEDASDTGGIDEFGRVIPVFSSHRSTGVIWCTKTCHSHPIAHRLRARISEVVRVHPHYFEGFQLLRYKKDQYYKSHHDSGGRREENAGKHRIYTFFVYLNDVEDGGETSFPILGLKVKPARGSAVLWPSVFNHDPWAIDIRTTHAAEVLKSGEKYSMNVWVHLGPYVLAHDIACAASTIA